MLLGIRGVGLFNVGLKQKGEMVVNLFSHTQLLEEELVFL
jgi:hypothetical protein